MSSLQKLRCFRAHSRYWWSASQFILGFFILRSIHWRSQSHSMSSDSLCTWNMYFCKIAPWWWSYEFIFCLSVDNYKETGSWKSVKHKVSELSIALYFQRWNTSNCLTFLWEWTSWAASFLAVPDPIQSLPLHIYLLLVSCGFFSGLGLSHS